jgi:hypothetical protein
VALARAAVTDGKGAGETSQVYVVENKPTGWYVFTPDGLCCQEMKITRD